MVDVNTLYTVMHEVCNYFIRKDDVRCYEGTVTIDSEGKLSFDVPSPYIIIRGSRKNDGLYYMDNERQIHKTMFVEGDMHPVEETFTGRVWFSYPTQEFIALCDNINKYEASIDITSRPIVAERFGSSERSYAKGENGSTVTWQSTFGSALRPYRVNMFEEIW